MSTNVLPTNWAHLLFTKLPFLGGAPSHPEKGGVLLATLLTEEETFGLCPGTRSKARLHPELPPSGRPQDCSCRTLYPNPFPPPPLEEHLSSSWGVVRLGAPTEAGLCASLLIAIISVNSYN